jgi:hypothetical protein
MHAFIQNVHRAITFTHTPKLLSCKGKEQKRKKNSRPAMIKNSSFLCYFQRRIRNELQLIDWWLS